MDLTKKIIIFLLVIVNSVLAEEWGNTFQQGNQFYQNGEYEQAIDSYLKIIENGFESGELYFNLGNAYYKIDELGKARLYYERASQFLKGDESLVENLKLLKMRLVDQIEPPPKFILSVWRDYVINLFNIEVLLWIEVILLWILLASFALKYYYHSRGRRERLNAIFTMILVIFIIFTLICLQKIYNLETERFAVIMIPSVTLLAEPKLGGTEVFVLHEGTKVKVERQNQNWYEIRLEDGKTGWLETNKIEII